MFVSMMRTRSAIVEQTMASLQWSLVRVLTLLVLKASLEHQHEQIEDSMSD